MHATPQTLLALALAACGGHADQASRLRTTPDPTSPTTIAVLPAEWATARPQITTDTTRSVRAGLAASHAAVAVRTPGRRSTAERPPGCVEDLACLRRAGARLGAEKVLAVALAELDRTVVVRLSLVDVRAGTREVARQRVVRGATSARVGAAIQSLAVDLGRPFARPPRQPGWYERWEVWAGVGATLAVAGGVTAYVATRGGGDGPDEVITPP